MDFITIQLCAETFLRGISFTLKIMLMFPCFNTRYEVHNNVVYIMKMMLLFLRFNFVCSNQESQTLWMKQLDTTNEIRPVSLSGLIRPVILSGLIWVMRFQSSLIYFMGLLQLLRFEFLTLSIMGNFDLSPMYLYLDIVLYVVMFMSVV